MCFTFRSFICMPSVKNVLKIEDHEMHGVNSSSSLNCTQNKIIGNPIYETITINNLTKIFRDSLQLNQLLFNFFN